MKILNAFLLIFTIIVLGCDKNSGEPDNCVVNSINDLEWLRAEVENNYSQPTTYSDVFVYQAFYLTKKVFFIEICCPACNTSPPDVKTCSGQKLGRLGFEIDNRFINGKKVIWRTNNGVCL